MRRYGLRVGWDDLRDRFELRRQPLYVFPRCVDVCAVHGEDVERLKASEELFERFLIESGNHDRDLHRAAPRLARIDLLQALAERGATERVAAAAASREARQEIRPSRRAPTGLTLSLAPKGWLNDLF